MISGFPLAVGVFIPSVVWLLSPLAVLSHKKELEVAEGLRRLTQG